MLNYLHNSFLANSKEINWAAMSLDQTHEL